MKKSRVTAILVAGVMVLTMLAGTVSVSADEAEDGKTYKIANLVKELGMAWYERQQVGLDEFNEENPGYEAFMVGPEVADAALQVQIMEDLIAQGVDAITIVPVSVETLEPVCKKAREAGIVVISHEAAGMENVDFDLEAFDNAAYGATLMDTLAELMGEKGQYATMVGFLTSKSHNEWMDAALARQLEAYPDMECVQEKIEENDDSSKAHDKTQELLKTYPDLAGILCSSMNGTYGVGLALDEAGAGEKVAAAGTCIASVSGEFLETGALDFTACWDPAGAGYGLNKVAKMVLDGEADQLGEGTDLGYKGYESLTIADKTLYGNDVIILTAENKDDYPF